jgi:V/A-type H+-transporting ATPase subunit D
MARLKLTKNELKRQREDLARFQRFLPTLHLKKQQLFIETKLAEEMLAANAQRQREVDTRLAAMGPLLAEAFDFEPFLEIAKLRVSESNIAGVPVPVLTELTFAEAIPDLLTTPPWIDDGIAVFQTGIRLAVERRVTEERIARLQAELSVTNQRINLFEKVKIPAARENIRRIRIALGDLQAAAVARAKLAKKKLLAVVGEAPKTEDAEESVEVPA